MVSVLEKTDDEDSANRTYRHRASIERNGQKVPIYLCSNVCNRAWCDLGHPMNPCIPRSSGFRFFINRTGGRKHMFVSLCNCKVSGAR